MTNTFTKVNPMTVTDATFTTVQQHILEEQKRFPGSSGEFSSILSGIVMASKMIQSKVRRAGLSNILGEHGKVNVQGEVQQKLDVYSNDVLAHFLGLRDQIGVLASEENEEPMIAVKHSISTSASNTFGHVFTIRQQDDSTESIRFTETNPIHRVFINMHMPMATQFRASIRRASTLPERQ